MTARKRVGMLPTHRLAVRHSVNYSSSDPFTSDDSLRDSLKTSLEFPSDDLSDSSSSHSSSDHSLPALPSDESSESSLPRETGLKDDVVVRGSDEPHLEQDIDLEIQAEIDECIAYADALRARGIEARVVVEAIDREESETGTRGLVEVRIERVMHPAIPDDIPKPTLEVRAVEVTYETLGYLVQRFDDHTKEILILQVQAIECVQKDQGHMIIVTGQQSVVLSERISDLERDNMRLRGTLDVASQRVSQLQRRELRVRREMRQI
nr:hypothetical protein [Tanacetum cinerariifolium]